LGPISAAGVISLDVEAVRVVGSVTDRIALRDADLREWMANRVVPAFLWANGMTLAALGVLVVLDEINIGYRRFPRQSPRCELFPVTKLYRYYSVITKMFL
jgi:hypothetical protein